MCRPTGKSIELKKMKTEYKAKKFNEEIELMTNDNPNIVDNKGNYFVLPDYHVKNQVTEMNIKALQVLFPMIFEGLTGH
jgi:outer membrane phospholipase A